ncbi:MAG: hypothetical protein KDD02_03395 [Phaeodactylibacter sp.]|nr:hypothetical protein [Phaeodactylibacter sp.]MCB9301870.1 hypothetical protein [Lewinellaceae bacterium]
MKFSFLFFFITLLSVALGGCKNEPAPPVMPEDVLKQYQGYIDKNDFVAARKLSTPAGQQWLVELAKIIASEQADSTMLDTRFLSLHCEGQSDTLLCSCVLQDQYEKYPAEYRLIRMDGQWLVDAPQEEIIIENDVIESIPDSLLQQMMDENMMEQ